MTDIFSKEVRSQGNGKSANPFFHNLVRQLDAI